MSKIVKPDLTYQWASAAGGGSNAYINDVRVSSGVVYSGNFTPPTSPF